MEPDEDARNRIFGGRLREAAIGTQHGRRIAACASGREFHATVLEADSVSAKYLLKHFGTDPSFDRVTGGVILVSRGWAQRCPGRVAGGVRIAVRLPGPNSGDRSPIAVMVFGGRHRNVAIRQRHIEESK